MNRGSPKIMDCQALDRLFAVLRDRGYQVIGPTVRDQAIVYDAVTGVADLPVGWTDVQQPGSYRLVRRQDQAVFGYGVGPQSWKQFLFPPRQQLFQVTRDGQGLRLNAAPPEAPRLAFIGVRACELQAIAIQDQVFQQGASVDNAYRRRREQIFVVAVHCGHAGQTCFCASMGSGPRVSGDFDLALTEIVDGCQQQLLVELGSDRGADVFQQVPQREATAAEIKAAAAVVDAAEAQMGRRLDAATVAERLGQRPEHPHWEAVARRCLSCANCTLVCPTCFCSTVEDVTDLAGQSAGRIRRWDSCFNQDFSTISGGRIRSSVMSRYRQWLTHKLSFWVEQFGRSGCVGCGRCITWCPVGIDLTVEAAALAE